ncbi:hypothetical protein HOY82DRAFT_575015 [Tuber indicum]|nr:hypothetical protein HOY82DRAFT_575015 [Tuber indicum]
MASREMFFFLTFPFPVFFCLPACLPPARLAPCTAGVREVRVWEGTGGGCLFGVVCGALPVCRLRLC